MALETLHGLTEIGGFSINEHDSFIKLSLSNNCIAFAVQKGPIKDVGVNGCQVDTILETAKLIIEGLNNKFPCIENTMALHRLDDVLIWLEKRRIDREKRGVEGHDLA